MKQLMRFHKDQISSRTRSSTSLERYKSTNASGMMRALNSSRRMMKRTSSLRNFQEDQIKHQMVQMEVHQDKTMDACLGKINFKDFRRTILANQMNRMRFWKQKWLDKLITMGEVQARQNVLLAVMMTPVVVVEKISRFTNKCPIRFSQLNKIAKIFKREQIKLPQQVMFKYLRTFLEKKFNDFKLQWSIPVDHCNSTLLHLIIRSVSNFAFLIIV